MTITEFNIINKAQQLQVLWDNGYVVNESNDGTFLYVLYRLFTFSVELKYSGKLLIALNVISFAEKQKTVSEREDVII